MYCLVFVLVLGFDINFVPIFGGSGVIVVWFGLFYPFHVF